MSGSDSGPGAGATAAGRLDGELAAQIRLVVLDVDGVLTDGGIYWTDAGTGESVGLRRFHVRDGLGVHMLRRASVSVVLVSGKQSEAVRRRARELEIGEVHQVDHRRKVATVREILSRHGVDWPETACLADDLADLGLMRRVGLPAAVADAAPEIRDAARWISRAPGGHGAVREFAEALLRSRGVWSDLVEDYEEELLEP